MDRVVVAVSDLMFRSKIREAASEAGVEVAFAKNADVLADLANGEGVSRIVVDLADQRFDAIAAIERLKRDRTSVPVIGFFPHVRVDLLGAARGVGCDSVLPRSAFVAHLGDILRGTYPKVGHEADT
jgi:DNA-binding NarL/FixJ family response regulator